MTAGIINLRKARKAKARAEAVKTASQNRVKFGRTKAEREQVSAVLKIGRSRLDGAQRANPGDEPREIPGGNDPGPISGPLPGPGKVS